MSNDELAVLVVFYLRAVSVMLEGYWLEGTGVLIPGWKSCCHSAFHEVTWDGGGIAPFILRLGIRWKFVVTGCLMPRKRPCLPRGELASGRPGARQNREISYPRWGSNHDSVAQPSRCHGCFIVLRLDDCDRCCVRWSGREAELQTLLNHRIWGAKHSFSAWIAVE